MLAQIKLMVQTRSAKDITVRELSDRFGVQLTEDENFFWEWQQRFPELEESEKQKLDRVKASYINLLDYPPLLESAVKTIVLSPLLDLAGFYLPPFHIKTEASIDIFDLDGETKVTGKIDVLLASNGFWIAAIESKRAAFSLEVGLAQLLAYLLGFPDRDRPRFGLLTNGANFLFVKLDRKAIARYSLSKMFYIRNPGNDLYPVLQILKQLKGAIDVS